MCVCVAVCVSLCVCVCVCCCVCVYVHVCAYVLGCMSGIVSLFSQKGKEDNNKSYSTENGRKMNYIQQFIIIYSDRLMTILFVEYMCKYRGSLFRILTPRYST